MNIKQKTWKIFAIIMIVSFIFEIYLFLVNNLGLYSINLGMYNTYLYITYNGLIYDFYYFLPYFFYEFFIIILLLAKLGFIISTYKLKGNKAQGRFLSLLLVLEIISICFYIFRCITDIGFVSFDEILLYIIVGFVPSLLSFIFYATVVYSIKKRKIHLDRVIKKIYNRSYIYAGLIFVIFVLSFFSYYYIYFIYGVSFIIYLIFSSFIHAFFLIFISLSFNLMKEDPFYIPENDLYSSVKDYNHLSKLKQSKDYNQLIKLKHSCYLSIGKAIILSIITFNIYFFIWIFRINLKTILLSKEDSSPGKSLAAFMFIPFYAFYWAYKKGQQLNKYYSSVGETTDDKSTTYLLLFIFGLGIVAVALIQNEINEIVLKETKNNSSTNLMDNPLLKDDYSLTSTRKDLSNPSNTALLKELAELHKNGILSDQEYNEKKAEILRRI